MTSYNELKLWKQYLGSKESKNFDNARKNANELSRLYKSDWKRLNSIPLEDARDAITKHLTLLQQDCGNTECIDNYVNTFVNLVVARDKRRDIEAHLHRESLKLVDDFMRQARALQREKEECERRIARLMESQKDRIQELKRH